MARKIKRRQRQYQFKFLDGPTPDLNELGQWVLDPTRQFELWIDGKYAGLFDTSPMGMVELLRTVEK